MEIAATRLQSSKLIVFSRILGIGFVLANIAINLSALPEYWTILNRGVGRDVYGTPQTDGTVIVSFVSSEAIEKGIAIGDTILNPDADSPGEIGTPLTFRVQSGDEPAREVTFERKPEDYTVQGGVLSGVSLQTSIMLGLLTRLLPFLMGSIAALLICWLKSDNWMALLIAVLLASAAAIPDITHPVAVIFMKVMGLLGFTWFLLFPNGRFAPRWSWAFILLVLPGSVLSVLIEAKFITWSDSLQGLWSIFDVLTYTAGLGIIGTIIFRYRRIFSPTERQQTKWIMTAAVVLLVPIIITGALYSYYWSISQYDLGFAAFFINMSVGAVGIILLILSVLFAVFQYRLYDVDAFITRALVYSGLTGILALVGFVATVSIDYFIREATGNQSGLIAAVISAAPIAALFNPVRERLQKAVDRRFQQEEIDFENTFIEFSAGLNQLFTKQELSTLLCEHAVEQLNISHASVFLNEKNTGLKHVRTVSLENEATNAILDNRTTEELSKGRLTSPEGDSARSLVIPLVVPRSRKPTLLGALVLGRRLHGLGYSSSMLERLQNFGEQVGKAFYVVEVREKKG